MTLGVGIVGCGLIGARRARFAAEAGDRVVAAADLDKRKARSLSDTYGSRWTTSWRDVVAAPDVDVVVVATYNSALAEVTEAALEAGKDVLCEKPFGRNAEEAGRLLETAEASRRIVKVGFTLRHHEAIARAHELVTLGSIGAPLAVRAAYGHGGRPGYDSEWRGDPELAGGGELLDQGVHVVDLCRWFMGEFVEVAGVVATWFWPVEPLEDNGFALLRTEDGRVASLHTSWTQWRNLFRFEILGSDGFVTVEGLGGSYGEERLVHGCRRPECGPPEMRSWAFDDPDASWRAEWAELASAVREERTPLGSVRDGYEAARLIDAIYASARAGSVARLEEVVGS